MTYKSIEYQTEGRVATIRLNRPDVLNAIDFNIPNEIEAAVEAANDDPAIHVIVVEGAGRAFCAGYDLKMYAETKGPNPGIQDMPWYPFKPGLRKTWFSAKFRRSSRFVRFSTGLAFRGPNLEIALPLMTSAYFGFFDPSVFLRR